MATHLPEPSAAAPLRYGCRVSLYKQAYDGRVVATSSANVPVGLRLEGEGGAVGMESAVFQLLPGDPVESAAPNRGEGEPVRYGQLVRLLHQIRQQPLGHHAELRASVSKGNLRVVLERNSDRSHVYERWRVMPRYHLRTEGDVVSDGDPVVLESAVDTRCLNVGGQHSEEARMSESDVLEVSCGYELQGFQMCLFDGDVGAGYTAATLRCGDCVSLRHTEENMYLSTDAANSSCRLQAEDFHVDEMGIDEEAVPGDLRSGAAVQRSMLAKPELSYRSLFVVESEDALMGGALRTRGSHLYRFKCLSSGQYLMTGARTAVLESYGDADGGAPTAFTDVPLEAANGGSVSLSFAPPPVSAYELSLTADGKDPATLFCLHNAAANGEEAVESGSRVFLEAPQTANGRLWIVAGKLSGIADVVEGDEDDAISVSRGGSVDGTQGSKTNLFSRPQRSMRDGVEICRLSSKSLEQVTMVRSLLPALEFFSERMLKGVGDPYTVRGVKDNVLALQRLLEQLPENDEGGMVPGSQGRGRVLNLEWQSKLLHQGVADVVLQTVRAILQCPYVDVGRLSTAEMTGPVEMTDDCSFVPMPHSDLGELVDLCLDLVGCIVAGRPQFAEILQAEVEFLMQCCAQLPSAMRCVAEFLRDNAALVELPRARSRLKFFLSLLKSRSRDPDLLKVLQLFAYCGGEGMVEAQKVIVDFLIADDVAESIFYHVRWATGDEEMLCQTAARSSAIAAVTSNVDLGMSTSSVLDRSVRVKDDRHLMVGIPNSIFSSGKGTSEVMSVTSLGSSRGRRGALDSLLLRAADAENASELTYFPMEGLVTVLADWPEVKDVFVPVFSRQLRLLSSLAFGRNTRACENLIFKLIPRDCLGGLALRATLPWSIHASLISLFANAVVDMDSTISLRTTVTKIRCAILSNTVIETSAVDSLRLVMEHPPPTMHDACDFALHYLSSTVLSGRDKVAFEYLAVVHLVEVLLDRGAFELAQYAFLGDVLTNALNPMTDEVRTGIQTDIVYVCKMRVLKLMNRLLDVIVARHALKLVDDFRFERHDLVAEECQLFPVVPTGPGVRTSARTRKLLAYLRLEEKHIDWSEGQILMSNLLRVVQDLVVITAGTPLRRKLIHLFFRLTNYLPELHQVATHVQLLSSHESVEFYEAISETATTLDSLMEKSFRRSNTVSLANAALDALDQFLAEAGYGALIDKLAIMRHMGVPRQLLLMVQRLPLPMNRPRRSLLARILGLLSTMAQDSVVLRDLRASAETIAPYLRHHADVLQLMRTLFIQHLDASVQTPRAVLEAIMVSLHQPQSTFACVRFLVDYLSLTGSSGLPIAQHQSMVWRLLVSTKTAVHQIHFKSWWCDPTHGRSNRAELLGSKDYFKPNGHLSKHLLLCKLLFLVADRNDVVHADEVRTEVFGTFALDRLVDVLVDDQMPMCIRAAYTSLLRVFFLEDSASLSSVFAHRRFGELLRMMRLDLCVYLQNMGGEVDDLFEDDVERREIVECQPSPSTPAEQEQDALRSGPIVVEHYVCEVLCRCLRRLCEGYHGSVGRLAGRVRSQVKLHVNETVDVLCDVLDYRRSNPDRATSHHYAQQMMECMRAAQRQGFTGTARWRDRFDRMLVYVEDLARLYPVSKEVTQSKDGVVSGAVSSAGSSVCDIAAKTEAGADSTALTPKWIEFLRWRLLDCARMREENRHASAAGVILRSGDRGSRFTTALLHTLPTLNAKHRAHVLRLVRQLVLLRRENPCDDGATLRFDDVSHNLPGLSLDMAMYSRQTYFARWAGDPRLEVPMPLVALAVEFVGSSSEELQSAALQCAITLLMNEHRAMQDRLNNFCRSSDDEMVFYMLRNNLSDVFDSLRAYRSELDRGSTMEDARHHLVHLNQCCLELKLLQLMCAGQYTPLQTYLIAQPGNSISVNLVESLVELLQVIPFIVNVDTTPFVQQLLATVTETLQGPCRVNQDNFAARGAALYLTQMLTTQWSRSEVERRKDGQLSNTEYGAVRKGRLTAISPHFALWEEERKMLHRIRSTALATLLALIEGRQDPLFTANLLRTMDLSVLATCMDRSAAEYEAVHGPVDRVVSKGIFSGDFVNSYRAFHQYMSEFVRRDHPTCREELEDELSVGVSIYIFFMACYDMQLLEMTRTVRLQSQLTKFSERSFDEFVDKRGNTIKQVLRRSSSHAKLASKVGKVEIVRNGVLERVYFRILSASSENLFESTKERIIRNAVRTSDNERLRDFFYRSHEVMVEMDSYSDLRRNIVLYMLHYCGSEIYFFAFILDLILNLLMVIGVRTATSPYTPGTRRLFRELLDTFGIVTICVHAGLTLHALAGPARVQLHARWALWRADQAEAKSRAARRDVASDDINVETQGVESIHKLSRVERFLRSTYYVVTTSELQQCLFFLAIAVLGRAHQRLWYSFLLMEIVLNSRILENLIGALTKSAGALLMTFILLVFVIFIFTNLSYYFFAELFDPLGQYNNGFNCFSLLQCLIVHLDNMRSGGGIGDLADWPTFYSASGSGYWFTFYRLAYYIIVSLIGFNLFFGMIIDSLAQFRATRDQVTEDQERKCFICGTERSDFDVIKGGTYDVHIEEEHHMWWYLFFLHYLSAKDPESFTGQEEYVWRHVKVRDITFYPIQRSILLETVNSTNEPAAGASDSEDGNGSETDSEVDNSPATITAMGATIQRATDPIRTKLDETADALHQLIAQLTSSRTLGATSMLIRADGLPSRPPPPPGDETAQEEPFSPQTMVSDTASDDTVPHPPPRLPPL